MTKAKNKWMTQVEEFFAANPEREFLFREMPLDAGRRTLNAVSAARWVVGAASCTPGPLGTFGISAYRGQKTVASVIRRANPAAGRPLPGVYFMDMGPMPPLPPGSTEEDLARRVWAFAQMAAHMEAPLVALTEFALMQAMAEGAPAAGGYRH